MGLGDQLSKVVDGLEDIVSAPFGFIWDLSQVSFREDLDFGDPFATGLTDIASGLSKVSEGSGVSWLARGVANNTPLDEALGGIIREAELLYNQEYQRELGQTPFGIQDLPFTEYDLQPGDVSIAKIASLGAQAAADPRRSNLVTNRQGLGNHYREMWRRADFTSPGQSFIASSLGAWDLPDKEREEFFSSIAFQFSSGLVDTVTRWYAQPECGRPFASAESAHRPALRQPPPGDFFSAIRTHEPATIFSVGPAESPCEPVRAENPPRARAYNSLLPTQKGISASLPKNCPQRIRRTCQMGFQAQMIPFPALFRPWPTFSDADRLSDCHLAYPLYTNITQTQ